jgi:hypothetical protein
MTLASEYYRQFRYRHWRSILDALPPLAGKIVLDLGCGVGDLAAEFVGRGARVIGVDNNENCSVRREPENFRTRNFGELTCVSYRISGSRRTVSGAVSQPHTFRSCLQRSAYGPEIWRGKVGSHSQKSMTSSDTNHLAPAQRSCSRPTQKRHWRWDGTTSIWAENLGTI